MTRFRKTLTASLAALTLGGAIASTSVTPAAANGWGWGGPAIAAGVIGGLALGAAAASSGYGYGYAPAYAAPVYYGCRVPTHDYWGNFTGYRRVAC